MVEAGATEAIGGIILFVMIGLGKSLINGKLRKAIQSRRESRAEERRKKQEQEELAVEAHSEIRQLTGKVDYVVEELKETKEHAKSADERAQDVGRAVFLFHEDELPDEKAKNLRERLGVDDVDGDILPD